MIKATDLTMKDVYELLVLYSLEADLLKAKDMNLGLKLETLLEEVQHRMSDILLPLKELMAGLELARQKGRVIKS